MARVPFLPSQTSHVAANPIPTPGHGRPTTPLTHLQRPHPTNRKARANNHRWKKKPAKAAGVQSSLLPSHGFRLKGPFGRGGSASIAGERRLASQRLRLRLQHPSPGLSGGWREGCGTGAGGHAGDDEHVRLRRQRWVRGLDSNQAGAEPKIY